MNVILNAEGTDEFGKYVIVHNSSSQVAHCSACGKQTEAIVIRQPDTDEEQWFGYCCDAQGDNNL